MLAVLATFRRRLYVYVYVCLRVYSSFRFSFRTRTLIVNLIQHIIILNKIAGVIKSGMEQRINNKIAQNVDTFHLVEL